MITEEEYWYWLCSTPEIWQQDIFRLMKIFGSPSEVFRAGEEMLRSCQTLNELQIHSLLDKERKKEFRNNLDKLKRNGIKFIYMTSIEYPERLKHIPDPPFGIYVKGKLPESERYSVGMVGARICSDYGSAMAQKYASALAAAGMQIISGMAKGIDSISARAAMEAGGTTFAILGSGIDVIYPAENIELYYEIIMKNGGIISEYPPGTKPVGWHFPHRNRLITGLSDKLLVIEARKHSGTLTTAMHALDQGVDIYALPGKTTDVLSEGCNNLIADGAGVLLGVDYLLDDIYGRRVRNAPVLARADGPETSSAQSPHKTFAEISRCSVTGSPVLAKSLTKVSPAKVKVATYGKKEKSEKKQKTLPNERGLIIEAIRKGKITAEDIGKSAGLSEPELSQMLCELELTGIIAQQGKDCYIML